MVPKVLMLIVRHPTKKNMHTMESYNSTLSISSITNKILFLSKSATRKTEIVIVRNYLLQPKNVLKR